jgi:hypothetical protein
MKKVLFVAAAVVGLSLLAKRAGRMCAHADFEAMIERMPDNAPPKWMFHNISAIRANTDRILDLLSREPTGSAETRTPAAA